MNGELFEFIIENLPAWAYRGAATAGAIKEKWGTSDSEKNQARNDIAEVVNLLTEDSTNDDQVEDEGEAVNGFCPCPRCGSTFGSGLGIAKTKKKGQLGVRHKIICLCGWQSMAFETIEQARVWNNTRNGVAPKETEVSVRHNNGVIHKK